ncbi:MAG: bifunctional phosphoribosylaminoimidazolecarboxamide formyltransferase/IMP cyclohydrolase, partial [Bdellovibrionales bacterium]|nr:bifunctional phosphoribosylaminoimidazolecarboxamide formyltransferase/IMP cyclohydrolase [Bdellovibrionales bacterium]
QKVTGNPEAFGGRMKTLSFQVSSGLLFRRDNQDDISQANELGIEAIDLVVCNLYPFEEVLKKNSDLDTLIENIDIGGPTMVRAAAKNYKYVTISTNPAQYDSLIEELERDNQTSFELRRDFALAAFQHTGRYDSIIAGALEERFEKEEATITLSPQNAKILRYGENPHQKAWVYANTLTEGLANATPIQGKELSYNNLLDADAAWRSLSDLVRFSQDKKEKNGVTIIKHSNPCGAALSTTQEKALEMAWMGDPVSSFGSIICFSHEVTEASAHWLSDKFVEVIMAPSFEAGALSVFGKKKNLRLIPIKPHSGDHKEPMIRSISGGWVVQEEDNGLDIEFQQVTKNQFDQSKVELAQFGTMVAKHLKSNAIALVRRTSDGLELIGAGMGNPNRLISLDQAVNKAKENKADDFSDMILISDAFFPFRDNIDLANKAGIKFIVQPGGSIRDKEVIEACDEFGMSMVFTGTRHFRH